ncbi:MAG: hypothetical protein BWZ02_00939 [Lentisphaerae bacterium ADurb.BinA184]|nr:MAG: hypothetical protein BWZ02_00939 [Lentisphaerae bacterium ADurb.BinA184]
MTTARPARGVVFLSALIWPGAGQLAQRRWLAGSLFMGAFALAALALLLCAGRILYAYYSLADFDTPVERAPSLHPLLWALAAAAAVYFLSLADTLLANQRAHHDPRPADRP